MLLLQPEGKVLGVVVKDAVHAGVNIHVEVQDKL